MDLQTQPELAAAVPIQNQDDWPCDPMVESQKRQALHGEDWKAASMPVALRHRLPSLKTAPPALLQALPEDV